MSDLADAARDAAESNGDNHPINNIVAILVALTATFMALCNVKDGNVVQGMAQAQANAIDSWSHYQSKSTKQSVAEGILDQLTIQRELGATTATPQNLAMLDKRIAEYHARVARYESEKNAIKTEAEGFQKQYDALNVHDDQFDMSEACLSVAIALLGVTALTKKRWLLAVAGVFLIGGVLFGIAGFAGWTLHPDFLARFLS